MRRRLMAWYEPNHRDLPWRRTSDPYAIWISEVMLQQTQVATVIPYYRRFLERFPTVAELAAAPVDEVLRYWEGLGYYRRARQMHAAAVRVVEHHVGVFPTAFDQVLALPGVGRYTAGAILSIATDQRLPVVEANTVRLYSRLIALRRPPSETQSVRLLWEVAESLLPERGSGRFNQAAMELGSLVCTPRDPDCPACPLGEVCAARRLGLQQEIPGKVKQVVYEQQNHWAVVAEHQGHYFLRQCPPGERWAGLWDFPRFDVTGQSDPSLYVQRQFHDQFGWPIDWRGHLHRLRHGVTKYRITLDAHRARPVAGGPAVRPPADVAECGEGWFAPESIQRLPLNTTGRKLARMLVEPTGR